LESTRAIAVRCWTTRSIVPTAPGQVFVSVAARLIEEMEHALDELRAQVERRSGLVVTAPRGLADPRGDRAGAEIPSRCSQQSGRVLHFHGHRIRRRRAIHA
jgi:DNA-binding transcriptional LysR family regulator